MFVFTIYSFDKHSVLAGGVKIHFSFWILGVVLRYPAGKLLKLIIVWYPTELNESISRYQDQDILDAGLSLRSMGLSRGNTILTTARSRYLNSNTVVNSRMVGCHQPFRQVIQ
jgi:hypothetical protein